MNNAIGDWFDMNRQIAVDFSEEFAKIADKYGYGDLGFSFLLLASLISVPIIWSVMNRKDDAISRTYLPYTTTDEFKDSSIMGKYQINSEGALELPKDESLFKKSIFGIVSKFPMSVAAGQIDELWERYDTDKNGVIDKQEAKGLIHHIFKKNDTQSWISDEMFEVLFRTMDLDDSGTIEK